ncbi:hypothetical protein JG688_00013202, partial [Phytophthora aleatoria]
WSIEHPRRRCSLCIRISIFWPRLSNGWIPCDELCASALPKVWRFWRAWLRIICSELKTLKEMAYVEQQPPSEITPTPTMEELQDLAGETTDKVHWSNVMGEMDTSAQFEEYEIAI